mmetsp:Transcript_96346/g.144226  ORF Transcript_96346/g.144226 Transcript_96346/m.144226 type:complete len:134 (+) Transcript_96346:72-473(+)|eukprot:CAMPEP_0117030678 /NCGR_PEP_ID=MMETSP0472-20121206/22127_1 /TAXON_ID=693140 ORGANISM="Tiarina fusus, Strain LIS" /NCGR_SAMPLE_ID=MMETSP0472 /ASSEMBLY_ACC=CAM_ASM_000603 /LENGTH=133 /DNA_ID=CAMNT_0004738825 /DNA_START=72 /DNA_END=473 /DNA_ORIENTATION=-
MSAAARAKVLAGYRRLNRARVQLFAGDDFAMGVSRQQMRAEFEKNRSVPTSGPQFEALVTGIDEAAEMLMHEIVRGKLNDDTGRYDFKVERKHVKGSDTGETKPELEHITEETVKRMENPGKVVVCKSSAKKD